MIGLDTNILVYAFRSDSLYFDQTRALLTELINKPSQLFVAWPSIYEFYRVVTSSTLFNFPNSRQDTLGFIKDLSEIKNLRFIGHGSSHLDMFLNLSEETDAKGRFIFDLQIATILLEHGVRKIFSSDADFRRFRSLEVVNPFS